MTPEVQNAEGQKIYRHSLTPCGSALQTEIVLSTEKEKRKGKWLRRPPPVVRAHPRLMVEGSRLAGGQGQGGKVHTERRE